ncbi:sphinganine C4-monooxygenase 1 [Brachypodium distachyon]|uniref:sphinganine C4-monooxygenase 1 n=1 Tax=Brachypodium distachyon TaxID=15368 RepID=UPI000D0CBB92|nr:sphinganine C4-monooxygenase 1 [Brachypodium distachyon]|eukprot:XP_024314743.1 sphinganine C4-monooxygenase 1 [Brachypodium distachyon]
MPLVALGCFLGRLVVEGDDLVLVQLLRGEETQTRIPLPMQEEILALLARFSACEVQHIYREGNQVAHILCQQAYHTRTLHDLFYFQLLLDPASSMMFSDEAVAAVVPIVVYWTYSGVHTALGHGRVLDKYRLNTKDEEESKNTVSKRAVLGNVLMQHLMQLVAVIVLTPVIAGRGARTGGDSSAVYLTAARQIAVAVVLYDGYRYAWHRLAHRSRFLYRHLHSWHHRLLVPYAFGAKYGHPSVWNGAAYHGVHHQPRGVRYNFSDLFFVTWDKAFGTHMPYAVEERPGSGGGLTLRPVPPPKQL